MNVRLTLAAMATLFTWNAGMAAEDETDIRFGASPGLVGVNYMGDDLRIAIGVGDGDVQAELFGVLSADENSSWIGELWVSDQRGGAKLNYHWLGGASSLAEAAASSGDVYVGKSFIAVDQNQFDDRKLTAGLGMERSEWFWGVYAMKSLTGERLVSQSILTEVDVLSGFQGNQEYLQDQFTDTITRVFEHPYDYGAGARIGRYFDRHLWRLRGGVDYENGESSADQLTFSLGLEKFFADTGHSLALTAEYLNKSGPFEVDKTDTRALLMYRYSFGTIFKPRRDTIETKVERRIEPQAAVTERRLVKNRITIDHRLLFDLDSSYLRGASKDILQVLQQGFAAMEIIGLIKVTGHTCDLASDQYNQWLSERRAKSVADLLADLGTSAESMVVSGMGEQQPRVANDSEANREKNRRVEIEFLTLEQKSSEEEVSAAIAGSTEVTWEREAITDPAWIERALRNPIQHKRTVDVYRLEESATSTRLGERVFINTFPEAADDAATTWQDQPISINVLLNDQDADGDVLSIIEFSQPSNGTVAVNGDDSLSYTPAPGFFGVDSFTYTIADARDAQSTATVTIEVIELPPLIANDDTASTVRNVAVAIAVLDNDQGDDPGVVSVGSPAYGTAVLTGNIVTYTPTRDYTGDDSFSYQISDAFGSTAQATVAITVGPSNQTPVAVDDAASTSKNTSLVIDVLANDSDADGDALTITSVTRMTEFGFGEITADNKILYTPMPGWWGGDELTYTIDDGFGGSATAIIVLDVLP